MTLKTCSPDLHLSEGPPPYQGGALPLSYSSKVLELLAYPGDRVKEVHVNLRGTEGELSGRGVTVPTLGFLKCSNKGEYK